MLGLRNTAKGIDFKGVEESIDYSIERNIDIRIDKKIRKSTCENATLSLFPCNIFLFRTNFILKITTRIKEEMLLNGMKILNFRADFIIWKRLGE